MSRWLAIGAAITAIAAPAAARADAGAGGQLRGFIEFKAGAADGERSFLDGGFGKARFGGSGESWAGQGFAEASLVWRPHITWSLGGYLHLRADPDQDHLVDIVEGYLTYRPMPFRGTRFSARAGLMYPPVSLEHDGLGWSTTDTITPSAINTWIGEEVKVLGVEATAKRAFGDQEVAFTVGAFGFNDTSGTILAYRGWAMHDVLNTAFGSLQMPEQAPAWTALKDQDPATEPVRELDGRVGFYGRLSWRPLGNLSLDLMHYDNAGDRVSYDDDQWSWETRFTNLGLRLDLDEETRVLAQAMTGQTILGQRTPMGYWVDTDFASAYVLLAHDIGEQTIAARLDYFETDDKSFTGVDNNNEDGWAFTADYRRRLSERTTLALEALHIESDRPQRATVGEDPKQEQTVLQSTLHVGF
ncbi:MAG TPA: hypothetical protein VG841_06785 [Caulobacterales bacterium]|nr:hypothetical protein [Caulobacterales bacterium]